jgi:hypothetical protein
MRRRWTSDASLVVRDRRLVVIVSALDLVGTLALAPV